MHRCHSLKSDRVRCATVIGRSLSTFKEKYGLFIGGKEIFPDKDTYFKIENPATGNHICHVAAATPEDVASAAEVAHSVFLNGKWSKVDVRERAKVLFNIAGNLRTNIPRLAEMEVEQTGRAVREMKAQLARLPEWFEYFGSLIRVHEGSVPPFLGSYINYVKHVPLGVCGLLTPWNHPMLIAIKKIAPALATGNSIVLKPSELAPVTVLELAKICTDSGLPDGVLNVLPGFRETGQAICSHPHVRKIDLTGGTNTGREVGAAAGRNLAGLVTELGGKAPMIVFRDADIDQAVNGAAFATFVASGQTCIAGARLLIHDSIYDEFLEKLVKKVSHIQLGDPTSMDTQMGPVISHASRERIIGMVDRARKEGGKVIAGGSIPVLQAPFDKGYYYQPTVIEVTKKMEIWREEVFGPVVVATRFSTEEEAVTLANDSPFGLAAAIWTKDVMRAHRIAEKLDVGIIWINDHHRNDPSSPWGGFKESGVGRENGLAALNEYTQTRSVVVRYDDSPFDWFEQKDARYS